MTRNLDLTDRTTRSQGDNFHQSILRLGGAAKLNALFKKDSVFVNGLIDGFHDATGTDLPPSPYQNQGKCVESFDYDQETATLVVGHSLGIPSSQDQFIYYPTITPGSAKGAPVQWMSACNLAVSNGSSTVVAEILPVQSKVQILVTRGGCKLPLQDLIVRQALTSHSSIERTACLNSATAGQQQSSSHQSFPTTLLHRPLSRRQPIRYHQWYMCHWHGLRYSYDRRYDRYVSSGYTLEGSSSDLQVISKLKRRLCGTLMEIFRDYLERSQL